MPILKIRAQIRTCANCTEDDPVVRSSILSNWITCARRAPDAVCVRHGNHELSHIELYRRAFAVAELLAKTTMSERANPVVGVCGPNSLETLQSILGVLLNGYAYSIIDLQTPIRHLSAIVDTLMPAAVLMAGHLEEAWERALRNTLLKRQIPCLDLTGAVRDPSVSLPESPKVPTKSDMAYVLFTSGSTGAPKGVCVSHEAACAALAAYVGDIGLDATDTVAGEVSFSFDVSVFDIFGSLWTGAILDVLDETLLKDSTATAQYLFDSQATVLFTVPSVTRELANKGTFSSRPIRLRALCMTGENVTLALLSNLRQILAPGTVVWNLFGGTEMPYVFAQKLIFGSDRDPSIFKWCSEYVEIGVDGDFSITPEDVGKTGILWVRGRSVFSGYLTPASPWPRADCTMRVHETGDVVEILPGGKIALLGRRDHQVRIKGYRVELDMVENWVERFYEVSGCIAVPDSEGQSILALLATEREPVEDEWEKELLAHCEDGLPPHMVPSRFSQTTELPTTRTGKKDRNEAKRVLYDFCNE